MNFSRALSQTVLRAMTVLIMALALLSGYASAQEPLVEKQTSSTPPKVKMVTNLGTLVIELYPAQAPVTVANFLRYVDEGFYRDSIFHRVIPNFMIQGGGFSPSLSQKATHDPITNESSNGLHNERGTLAMARTQQIHSATAQFFINLVNNSYLDYQPGRYGYAVFGKVVEGMEVVDRIAQQPTGVRNGMENVPLEPVVIQSVSRLQANPVQP